MRIRLRIKGQLTLPEELRSAAGLAEGAFLNAELTDEGILLRPEHVIDATQAWFWAPEWQAGEAEADADDAAERGETFNSADKFVEALRTGAKPVKRRAQWMSAFRLLPEFRSRFAELTKPDQEAFLVAFTHFVEDLGGPQSRPGLRVKSLIGRPGIYEMTWAPYGRATFRYGEPLRAGEPHIIWRCIGTHPVVHRA
jgi:bifunctional DNA-binding transcriptional regulator/antitoxin component of YhaV-PrlF toxin-antitoxin module